jgi:hypothetical protein
MAGIAWLVCSASLGYAAYLQEGYAATEGWWASAIAVYLGLRLLTGAEGRHMWISVLGAITLLLFAADANAKTSNLSEFFILAVIWGLAAGIITVLGLLRLSHPQRDPEDVDEFASLKELALEMRVAPAPMLGTLDRTERLPRASASRSREDHVPAAAAAATLNTELAFEMLAAEPAPMFGTLDRPERPAPAPASLNREDAVSLVAAAASTYACPYLGLYDDPETRSMFAAADHRCHAASNPEMIDLSHQESYCLSDSFRACARFRESDQVVAPVVARGHVSTRFPANGEAVFALPIHRLRGAAPGAYVPKLVHAVPDRTNAISNSPSGPGPVSSQAVGGG